MYSTLLISTISALKMQKIYLPILVLLVSILYSSSALSSDAKASMYDAKASINKSGQCVILLHGLARTSNSMEIMEKALNEAGYHTVNIDYPSRSMKIQELTPLAMNRGVNDCQSKDATVIHIVTHSMGGILARYYLAKNELPRFGHLVQLAPPNKGSLITDKFRNEHWYKWLTGPAGQQLGTGKDGIPGLLGPVDYSTGVIAGDEHSAIDNWLAEEIPGKDDGKVSVGNAKVEGMRDFIVVPHNHISIMKQLEVIRQTLYFLKHGNFNHPG